MRKWKYLYIYIYINYFLLLLSPSLYGNCFFNKYFLLHIKNSVTDYWYKITVCNQNNSFSSHIFKLEIKCNTSVRVVPRYQITYVFLCTFEVLCTFKEVISATMQDEILQLSENHIFYIYEISHYIRKW